MNMQCISFRSICMLFTRGMYYGRRRGRLQVCRFVFTAKLWKLSMCPMSKVNVFNNRWIRSGKMFVSFAASAKSSVLRTRTTSKSQCSSTLPGSCVRRRECWNNQCIYPKLSCTNKCTLHATQPGTVILYASINISNHIHSTGSRSCTSSHRETKIAGMG